MLHIRCGSDVVNKVVFHIRLVSNAVRDKKFQFKGMVSGTLFDGRIIGHMLKVLYRSSIEDYG